MKKSRWTWFIVLSVFLVIVLMIGATIGYLLFHVDYGNDTIMFYENNGCKVYVDSETKSKLSNETYFEKTAKSIDFDPEINETIAEEIALQFFKEAKPEKSDGQEYWFAEKGGPGQIIISDLYDYDVIFNRNHSLSKERLSDDELTGIAENLVIKYRGNISDLKISHISGSKTSMGNDRTGKETFLGYGDYIVEFRQYIDGIVVTGERGRMVVGIDPFGIPCHYRDCTIRIFNLTEDNNKIKKPSEILKEFTERRGSEFDYTLEDIDLVFNFHSDHAYLEYGLFVKARTKYYQPETEYFYA